MSVTLPEWPRINNRAGCAAFVFAVSATVSATVPAVGPAAAELAAHRATYDLSLGTLRSGSEIADVRGTLAFSLSDACDGWTVEERYQLRFLYPAGDEVEMATTFVTWEAKDGGTYRFNFRKVMNGEVEEEMRGEADAGAGVVRYARPEGSELALPPGVVFPTAHTIALIEEARSGGKFLSAMVFDGSDASGWTEIGAAIGLGRTAEAGEAGALTGGGFWPVRMAFFPPDAQEAAPDYEMEIDLLENGVARSVLVDYGGFTVSATLREVEALPGPSC